jgi:hypothetical protein
MSATDQGAGHDTGQDIELLRELQRRRAELRASMGELERALASPIGTGRAVAWTARLRTALHELYDDFAEHVAITEGPQGLYSELSHASPRLAHRIERLTEEHGRIALQLEQLLTWADVNDVNPDIPQARRAGTDLLVALMHHRQRGADLLFEAYEVDIGGET